MPGVHPAEQAPVDGASIRSEPAVALRELLAIREIAHALLQADSPDDVYQFALDRVTPLLGAAFSLVLRLDADGELLRPVAQHEWPSAHRGWIGALRVRVGRGPSGTAVAEGRVVEVEDVFADPASAEWHDIARELGFRSIVAAPLVGRHGATGAVAFYFAHETQVTDEQRALVRVVCEQLAATVDKAALIEELRRANGALAEANAELERQAERAARERRGAATDRRAFVRALREAVGAEGGGEDPSRLAAVRALVAVAESWWPDATLGDGTAGGVSDDVDARAPLLAVAQRWRRLARAVPLVVREPVVRLPSVRTQERWLVRLLDLVVGRAVADALVAGGTVTADIELERGFVAYRVDWRRVAATGAATAPAAADAVTTHGPDDAMVLARCTRFDEALMQRLATRLGGHLRHESSGHDDQARSLLVVLPLDAGPAVLDADASPDSISQAT